MVNITQYEEDALREESKNLLKHIRRALNFSAPVELIGSYAVVSTSYADYTIEKVETLSQAERLFRISERDDYYVSIRGLPYSVSVTFFYDRESAEQCQKSKIKLFNISKELMSRSFSEKFSSYFEKFSEIRPPVQLAKRELERQLQDEGCTKDCKLYGIWKRENKNKSNRIKWYSSL